VNKMPKEKYIYPKNHLLKMRLDTLIKNKGFNKPKFYKKMEVSPQLWYFYSWGNLENAHLYEN